MKNNNKWRKSNKKEKKMLNINTQLLSLVNNQDMTFLIKERLYKILLRYEYCRLNKKLHYPVNINEIDLNEFNKHLIGFIEGDGSIKSGKRQGHKKGLYRFSPNMSIKLHSVDIPYLKLIIILLNLDTIKPYLYPENIQKATSITISKESQLSCLFNIVESNQNFLTQKKRRDYKEIKDLLNYISSTKLIKHDLDWLSKGEELIKNLNTYKDLNQDKEEYLKLISKDITWEYILGFIEAEGSLVLHYNKIKDNIWCTFEITQTKSNGLILYAILDFIKNFNDPLIIKQNVELKTKGILEDKGKSRKEILNRLVLISNDYLYYKLIPLMLSKDLYTKMQINLVYFILGVIILKYNKKDLKCRELYFKLKKNMNINNPQEWISLEEILDVLNDLDYSKN